MISTYFRIKRAVAFALAGIIVLLIANTELVWATSYVETLATIDSIERTCAEGRSGRTRAAAGAFAMWRAARLFRAPTAAPSWS